MEAEKTIEQLIREQLEANKERLIKDGFEAVKLTCASNFEWAIRHEVEKQIGGLFEDAETKAAIAEVAREVKEEMKENFMAQIREVLPQIGAAFATSLHQRMLKNITGDSYKMRDLWKNLLES